jgi:hypothetical protein
MDGPDIVAHTLSWPAIPDKFGNVWQYHPRSDRHSKVACWAVFFDLLQNSALLRRHVTDGKVVFGVNHEMSDFKTRRRKKLDLVVARPGTTPTGGTAGRARTITELGGKIGVRLSPQQQANLAALPPAVEGPVGSVLIALEAKATMTEHGKARPRLYDELNSSHLTIHGAADQAIAVGFVMLNAASTFISPDRNKFDLSTQPPILNEHKQPAATEVVEAKVRELPRRTRPGEEGFDSLGIVVVHCRNDGTPITVVSGPPAPTPNDLFHYDSMIRRAVQQYDFLYAGI